MRFLASEVKFVDYNDRPYEEVQAASYNTVQSKMNMFSPNEDFDL